MSDDEIRKFQDAVWRYYAEHGRHDLLWRLPEVGGGFDPYKVMVSELMLQQTQVPRVLPKYVQFLELFPTVQDLAKASLGDVLVAWQGLGYNRRAKFLWQAAQMVVNDMGGEFPEDQKELTKLPGIGMNTAGAIMAYAFNKPVIFIETNVRTVYIHHFFGDETDIPDKAIEALVSQTVPSDNPREWYWALMDYGTSIKQQFGNKSRASKSYAKQSPFKGSKRAVRGAVIRKLAERPYNYEILEQAITDPRLEDVVHDLVREGMVVQSGEGYSLA
jgi:A/G-specific adenine glycosylase